MSDTSTQPLGARVAATLRRAGLDLLYLVLGLATSILALVVWVAGVSATLSLLLLVVGLPVALLAFLVFRATAELDRRTAALVHGHALRGRYRARRGKGFLARLRSTGTDPQTWRDLLWLVVHSVVGFTLGVIALSLVATVLGLATLPLWYSAFPEGTEVGLWTADTLPEALAATALALPAAALAVVLLRGMAIVEGTLAGVLLGSGDDGVPGL